MSAFANGARVVWVSNKGRTRKASVVTTMRCSPHVLLRITDGLPGEPGTCRVVPPGRLTVEKDGR